MPFATILTAVIFMLCIAQVGPGLVLIPAVIWVYSTRGAVWGTGFLVWAIFCSTFDNFLRPVLIKQGADLPLLLIFAGVIGGLHRLRRHRPLHRAGGARGGVHAARRLGVAGAGGGARAVHLIRRHRRFAWHPTC